MSEKPLIYQSTVHFAGLKGKNAAQAPGADAITGAGAISVETGTCTDAEPFALQVKGDSMAPEFPDGCVVIVDPSITAKDGFFVIADCGQQGYLLGELKVCDGNWYLTTNDKKTNTQIKIAPDQSAILGVVAQRSGTGKRANKIYNYTT